MATLRDIKRRITGVRSTSKITSAMKMVSAAKLKRAQRAIESARPYFLQLEDMMTNVISGVAEDYKHDLIQTRDEVKHITAIVVSSDRGLCGSFNSSLYRYSENKLQEMITDEYPDAKVEVIAVGKKSRSYFNKSKLNMTASHVDLFANLQFPVVKEILTSTVDNFISGKTDKVIVFYNEFINVVKQDSAYKVILPLQIKESESKGSNVDYIFEPDKESLLDELIPKLIDIQLWRALLESHAAEHAARMMAMDNATNNANDLIKHLELVYNNARQAAITTEMLEIVSGAEALRNV